jgi:hypothetical protein
MFWEPVGLFGHLGPANLTFAEVMASVEVETGAEVLTALLAADRTRVNGIFRFPSEWAGAFAQLGPFHGEDPQKLATAHLQWRKDCFFWQTLERYFGDVLAARMQVHGMSHIEALRASSTPFMLAPKHMLQFNLLPRALATLGFRTAMVSPAEPENVDDINARQDTHKLISSADPLVLARLRQEVKRGRMAVTYPDAFRGGTPPSEILTIFGEPYVMVSSWHLFSLYERLPVVPCHVTCGPDLVPQLTFGEPLGPPSNDDEAWAMAQQLLRHYEGPLAAVKVEWEGWTEGIWTTVAGSSDRVPGMREWQERSAARYRKVVTAQTNPADAD